MSATPGETRSDKKCHNLRREMSDRYDWLEDAPCVDPVTRSGRIWIALAENCILSLLGVIFAYCARPIALLGRTKNRRVRAIDGAGGEARAELGVICGVHQVMLCFLE